MENRNVKGDLFVVSAPSGAGKTTLCGMLRRRFPDLVYSVSYTTRAPRKGEQNGVDYHFIDTDTFLSMRNEQQWAEWAEVHGHYYGTAAAPVQAAVNAGKDVLLDIDVQGAMQILERFPDAVTIFIAPPSMAVLQKRLAERGTDAPQTIAARMRNAAAEMAYRHRYDYVVINDRLETAADQLAGIVAGKRREAQG